MNQTFDLKKYVNFSARLHLYDKYLQISPKLFAFRPNIIRYGDSIMIAIRNIDLCLITGKIHNLFFCCFRPKTWDYGFLLIRQPANITVLGVKFALLFNGLLNRNHEITIANGSDGFRGANV